MYSLQLKAHGPGPGAPLLSEVRTGSGDDGLVWVLGPGGDIRDGWRERAAMKARPGDSTWTQTMPLFVAVNESGKLGDLYHYYFGKNLYLCEPTLI